MELGVADRFILLTILPQLGDITTLKIVRRLREDLSFNEEEHKLCNFRQDGDLVKWDETATFMKDIPIGEKATDIIVEAFKQLNARRELREEYLSLYEKFVK